MPSERRFEYLIATRGDTSGVEAVMQAEKARLEVTHKTTAAIHEQAAAMQKEAAEGAKGIDAMKARLGDLQQAFKAGATGTLVTDEIKKLEAELAKAAEEAKKTAQAVQSVVNAPASSPSPALPRLPKPQRPARPLRNGGGDEDEAPSFDDKVKEEIKDIKRDRRINRAAMDSINDLRDPMGTSQEVLGRVLGGLGASIPALSSVFGTLMSVGAGVHQVFAQMVQDTPGLGDEITNLQQTFGRFATQGLARLIGDGGDWKKTIEGWITAMGGETEAMKRAHGPIEGYIEMHAKVKTAVEDVQKALAEEDAAIKKNATLAEEALSNFADTNKEMSDQLAQDLKADEERIKNDATKSEREKAEELLKIHAKYLADRRTQNMLDAAKDKMEADKKLKEAWDHADQMEGMLNKQQAGDKAINEYLERDAEIANRSVQMRARKEEMDKLRVKDPDQKQKWDKLSDEQDKDAYVIRNLQRAQNYSWENELPRDSEGKPALSGKGTDEARKALKADREAATNELRGKVDEAKRNLDQALVENDVAKRKVERKVEANKEAEKKLEQGIDKERASLPAQESPGLHNEASAAAQEVEKLRKKIRGDDAPAKGTPEFYKLQSELNDAIAKANRLSKAAADEKNAGGKPVEPQGTTSPVAATGPVATSSPAGSSAPVAGNGGVALSPQTTGDISAIRADVHFIATHGGGAPSHSDTHGTGGGGGRAQGRVASHGHEGSPPSPKLSREDVENKLKDYAQRDYEHTVKGLKKTLDDTKDPKGQEAVAKRMVEAAQKFQGRMEDLKDATDRHLAEQEAGGGGDFRKGAGHSRHVGDNDGEVTGRRGSYGRGHSGGGGGGALGPMTAEDVAPMAGAIGQQVGQAMAQHLPQAFARGMDLHQKQQPKVVEAPKAKQGMELAREMTITRTDISMGKGWKPGQGFTEAEAQEKNAAALKGKPGEGGAVPGLPQGADGEGNGPVDHQVHAWNKALEEGAKKMGLHLTDSAAKIAEGHGFLSEAAQALHGVAQAAAGQSEMTAKLGRRMGHMQRAVFEIE